MEQKAERNSTPQEYFCYDTRTGVVYKFRRMNKYILLQSLPFAALMKLSLEEFDDFFEGTPEPMSPMLMVR